MNRKPSLRFHLLLVALCYWALYVQLTFRIPGGYILLLLPVIGIGATSLTVLVMVLRFMGSVPVEEPFRTMFRCIQQVSSAFIAAFGLYNALVYINAQWDKATLQTVASEILEIDGGEIDLGYPVHYFWADLRSWRSHNAERLVLTLSERENLWVGRPVSLRLHRGYFGIPWVSAISPDQEKEWIEIITKIPTASSPRQNLTYLYLEQHRWKEVRSLAAEQMHYYPNDLVFVRYVTGVLLNAYRYAEIVSLLEPIAKQRRDYKIEVTLGFALSMTGRKQEGLKYIESAIIKEPGNYWGYFALGYAHFYTGTAQKAIPYFRKVLEIRPGFPEIQDILAKIQKAESQP